MSHFIIPSVDQIKDIWSQSNKPVLAYFTAVWCGPCKMQAPVLEAFAAKHATELDVVKLDIEEHPELASQVGIRSVPTLMLVKDGKVLVSRAGVQNASALETLLDNLPK